MLLDLFFPFVVDPQERFDILLLASDVDRIDDTIIRVKGNSRSVLFPGAMFEVNLSVFQILIQIIYR